MLTTLGELKDSRLKEVAQTCADSAEFASLVNSACERLMRRGDWPGTVVPIWVCVRNGCVTWPRAVGKVRRINRCGQEIRIGSLWFDYVDKDVYMGWGRSWGWGTGGWLSGGNIRNAYAGASMNNQGRYCTYSDIANADRTLRAYCLCPEDVGKTLTIFGIDNGNQTLRTHNADGTYTDGITLTLAVPYADTSVYVRRIDRVLKQVTQMNVPLYAHDAVNNVDEDLANYEPGETNPSYERDRLSAGCVSGNCTFGVAALVKLKFIKAVSDNDLVLIDNIDALKFAMQAIKLEENGNDAAAQSKLLKAVQELNLGLSDEFPLETTPTDSGFMGSSGLGSQRMI